MKDVQVHMASTFQVEPFGDWFARCRCEWSTPNVATREEARALGEVHLAEANGRQPERSRVDELQADFDALRRRVGEDGVMVLWQDSVFLMGSVSLAIHDATEESERQKLQALKASILTWLLSQVPG